MWHIRTPQAECAWATHRNSRDPASKSRTMCLQNMCFPDVCKTSRGVVLLLSEYKHCRNRSTLILRTPLVNEVIISSLRHPTKLYLFFCSDGQRSYNSFLRCAAETRCDSLYKDFVPISHPARSPLALQRSSSRATPCPALVSLPVAHPKRPKFICPMHYSPVRSQEARKTISNKICW